MSTKYNPLHDDPFDLTNDLDDDTPYESEREKKKRLREEQDADDIDDDPYYGKKI